MSMLVFAAFVGGIVVVVGLVVLVFSFFRRIVRFSSSMTVAIVVSGVWGFRFC